MSKSKKHVLKRIVSVLLAVVLVLGIMPRDFAKAAGEGVTLRVTDRESNPIAGAKVNYEITDSDKTIIYSGEGETDMDGNLLVLPVDQYQSGLTLSATIAKDGYIEAELQEQEISEDSAVISHVLNPLKEISVNVKPYQGTYDGKEHKAVTLNFTDGSEAKDYDITYRFGDSTEKVYEVPTIVEAKKYKVTVIIEREDYRTYTETVEDIEIKPAEQSLNFTESAYQNGGSTDVSDPIGEKTIFDFSAKPSNPANTPVSYSLEVLEPEEGMQAASGSDAAEIDSDGILTVKDAGSFCVTAKLAKTDNYKDEATISHTLNVQAVPEKEGDFISFDKKKVSYTFGADEGVVSKQQATHHSPYDNGAITYAMDKTDIGLSCDDKTGEITITDYSILSDALAKAENDALEVKVTANKAETSYYAGDTTSYTVTIQFEETPSNAFHLTGNKTGDKWYKGSVTVTPSEGYSISETVEGTYGDKVVLSDNEGTEQFIYLKKENGGITDKISVGSLFIDTGAPTEIGIDYSQSISETVLGSITNWYNDEVELTFRAKDTVSGVAKFEYQLGTTNERGVITDIIEKDGFYVGTVTLPKTEAAVLEGAVTVNAYDAAGNCAQYDDADRHYLVIDKVSPQIEVGYSEPENEVDGIRYYADEVTITPTVAEDYFSGSFVNVQVKKDGKDYSNDTISGMSWKQEDKDHSSSFSLTEEGDYVITITCQDYATNESETYSSQIRIDKTSPEIAVTYDNNDTKQKIGDREYYAANRTATITITERNFRPDEVEFAVEATDVANQKAETFSYSKLTDWSDWTPSKDDANTWTATVPFETDANYNVQLTYTDIAKNKVKEAYASSFTVDKVAPTTPKVTYSESILDKIMKTVSFGFYKPSVTVTLESSDETSGIDYFEWKYTKQDGASNVNKETTEFKKIVPSDSEYSEEGRKATVSFTVEAQARGHITAKAIDRSANVSEKEDSNHIVVVDTIAPNVTIGYSGDALQEKVEKDKESGKPTRQTVESADGDTRFVYNGTISATITATEANFYEDMEIIVTRDGEEITDYKDSSWKRTANADEYERTLEFEKDGDYVIKVKYADRSGNVMSYESGEYKDKKGKEVYVSNIHTIDTTAPTYTVTYDNNDTKQKIGDREYYAANRTATITVTDRNFRPNEVEFAVEVTDVANQKAETFSYSKLTDWSDWTPSKDDANTWTATVPFETDANYNVQLTYTDIAKNKVKEAYASSFTVDKVAPTTPKITYSESILDKVFETITFGFYKPSVTVTLESSDETAGIDYFEWKYTKQDGASNVNKETTEFKKIVPSDSEYSEEGRKATVSFTVEAQARGYITAKSYDRAWNNQEKADTESIRVVDTLSPEVSISYQAKDEKNTKVQFVNGEANTVKDFASATQAYYNGNATATIAVNEANFFEGMQEKSGVVHEVGILLKKTDDAGKTTQIEYLPENSARKYPNAELTKTFVWATDKTNPDIHTMTIDYEENADYVLTFEYADWSANQANIKGNDGTHTRTTYTSKIVTIDKISPVVTVEYSNKNVKNTIQGRKYFDAQQTATITVTEHNFRADDMAAEFEAKNVIDKDVKTLNYANILAKRSSWKHYDATGKEVKDVKLADKHVAVITYDVNANYTFDFEYNDLAMNSSENYAKDKFTVDKIAPKHLKVSYSTSVFENVLKAITFGYYDEQVTVTISAEDETSGIWHYLYSYAKEEGVSKVNAQLLDKAIRNARIQYDGKKATTTFKIPKSALGANNQFNGTVKFTAYDRADLSSEKKDKKRIIVDNISPKATVSYNEPVQTANDAVYYDNSIDTTIDITEANFYAEDVEVVVTKDEKTIPVTVDWTDNSVDSHTGTFRLQEDGDYLITINYADRSTNKMSEYVSERMIIDSEKPVINVTNIKNQSANSKEKIGMSISVTDKNIALSDFRPELTSVIKESTGKNKFRYKTVAVDLGEAKTGKTSDGETTYTYTVDNLDKDGYYSLACSAVDHANHKVTAINTENRNGEHNSVNMVNFSVNRKGSVFWVETEHNDKYSDKTYSDKLDGAYANDKINVKLHEINVDKVDLKKDEEHSTIFTLNDGSEAKDITLKEKDGSGKGNYEKNVRVGSGGWYENIYSLDNDNFDHDGVYSLNIITYDQAKNSNVNTKSEEGSISFTLDRTQPVISSNVSSDQRIKATDFPVEFAIAETNLDTDTIQVKLNGKRIAAEEIGNNEYRFHISDGLNQSFEITAKDLAGNESELYKIDKFTISTNIFVLWYANTVLFWSSLAGVFVLAGAVIVLILLKKRKKQVE